MKEALDLMRQALMLHEQVRRNRHRNHRRELNIQARDAVGHPERCGRAETMILIDGKAQPSSRLV